MLLQRRECERTRHDDDVRAGHCDSRVAASNAPRKCPGGKGWIGGGAQASSPSYRRFDARAEGEKRISLPVVVEVPVGVERECEYMRVCIAVCFRECISSASRGRARKIYETLRRRRGIENNDEENDDKRRYIIEDDALSASRLSLPIRPGSQRKVARESGRGCRTP